MRDIVGIVGILWASLYIITSIVAYLKGDDKKAIWDLVVALCIIVVMVILRTMLIGV